MMMKIENVLNDNENEDNGTVETPNLKRSRKASKNQTRKNPQDMLNQLTKILKEDPIADAEPFSNIGGLCYMKLEALKLLRDICNEGFISETQYEEKQKDFVNSIQF